MRVYQKGGEAKNRLIDYTAFVNALRLPLEGRRLDIVKQSYDQIGGGCGGGRGRRRRRTPPTLRWIG